MEYLINPTKTLHHGTYVFGVFGTAVCAGILHHSTAEFHRYKDEWSLFITSQVPQVEYHINHTNMSDSLISERWKDETLHHLGTYVSLHRSSPLQPPVLNIELRLCIEVIRAANDD